MQSLLRFQNGDIIEHSCHALLVAKSAQYFQSIIEKPQGANIIAKAPCMQASTIQQPASNLQQACCRLSRCANTGIRLIAATLVMAALLAFVLNPLVDPWTGRGLADRAVALLALTVSGAVVYFGLVFGLGAYSFGTLMGQLRRKR